MMKDSSPAAIRVIGVGNLWRGDDAVGLLAARLLRERQGPSIEVIDGEGNGLVLLEMMEGVDHVVFIDAVKGGGRPGEIIRLDLSMESRWENTVSCSTHAMGLAQVIDLARILGRLPKHVVLYGIVIESAESGAPLSEAARAGLETVVMQVNEEVERVRCTKCI